LQAELAALVRPFRPSKARDAEGWPSDADEAIVRFGSDWGVSNGTWIATFRGIADVLVDRGEASS
jgi:hypothetical protein